MKILLDENLDHRLRRHLGAHDVYAVDHMRWSGLKNGELLRVAEAPRSPRFPPSTFDILKPNVSLVIAATESAAPGAFLDG